MATGTSRQSRPMLTTWNEVASYLGKGVRTVQRWEANLSLPVRRKNNILVICAYFFHRQMTASPSFFVFLLYPLISKMRAKTPQKNSILPIMPPTDLNALFAKADALLEESLSARYSQGNAVAERSCLREECAAIRQEIKAARE